MISATWYQRSLTWGLYVLLFTPLFVANSSFFPFITGKNFAFRIIIEILTALWFLIVLQDPPSRPKRGILPWLMLGLTSAVLISTFFSVDPYRSFWSNFERMEGAVTYLHLLLYFIILISTLSNLKSWRRFWQVNVVASMGVALVALSQIFGLYSIHQGSVRLDATLGNSAYLAVYMLFGFFYTAFLWIGLKKRGVMWYLYPLCALIQLFILYKTATRGAILGLLLGLLVTGAIVWFRGKEYPLARRIAGISIATVIVVVGLFFIARNTHFVQTSPVLSRFAAISLSERTTESRLIIWNISLKGFAEHPIFGWGPENYSVVFNKYYDPRLWRQEQWFDRSHNIVIDWLVMTGLVGAFFYLSLYIAGLVQLWSKKTSFSVPERAVLTGLLCGYLFQNLFIFDNIISLILFVATLAYIHTQSAANVESIGERLPRVKTSLWGVGVVLIITVAVLYYVNAQPLLASRDLIQAFTPQAQGLTKNINTFESVFKRNTFANTEASLQLISFTQNILTEPAVSNEVKQSLFQFTADTVEHEISLHPLDARPILIYGTFLSRTNQLERAEEYLNKALILSPLKQAITFETARVQLNSNRPKEALAALKQTFESDPNYLEARERYALVAIDAGDTALANQLMEEVYGTQAVPDRRFTAWYARQKNYKRAAESLEGVLNEQGVSSDDDIFLLAGLYLYAGNREHSVEILDRLKIDTNSSSTQAKTEQLLTAIKAGLNPFEFE